MFSIPTCSTVSFASPLAMVAAPGAGLARVGAHAAEVLPADRKGRGGDHEAQAAARTGELKPG